MAEQKQDDQLEDTYIQQLCEDTGCSPEDLPAAMNDREKWRERVRDIRAGSVTWWIQRNLSIVIKGKYEVYSRCIQIEAVFTKIRDYSLFIFPVVPTAVISHFQQGLEYVDWIFYWKVDPTQT